MNCNNISVFTAFLSNICNIQCKNAHSYILNYFYFAHKTNKADKLNQGNSGRLHSKICPRGTLISVKQAWDNTFPAAVTLQVGLTFQGEAGFPQLHSWRPKVFQGKSSSGQTPAGEARCDRSQTEAERALELGETRRRASQRLTHIQKHTDGEMCVHTHTRIHTGVRTVRTDSCRGVVCIGLDSLIQPAHTHTHTLNCFSHAVWRVAHSSTLPVQAWQETHWGLLST